MENASKALLIAGAILISILIIAIGMFVFQAAQSPIQTAAGQMGQQEKQMYNSMIEKYIGNSKKGTEVKQMINDIISQNNQYVNESGKFICVQSDGVTGFSDQCIGQNADAYTGGENNQTNIDSATTLMRQLSAKIIAGKSYTVSGEENGGTTDGIIHIVTVRPNT